MVILCCPVTPHPEKINLSVTSGFCFWKDTGYLSLKWSWLKFCYSLSHHCVIMSDMFCWVQLDVFQWLPGRLFEWLLRRCFFSWNVLLLHWTLYLRGGKRSGAEVCCKLQESEQSTSSVQVLKGQFAKLPNSNLLGCRSVRIKHKQCVQLMCYLSQNCCNLD